jgi:hypothetical protein
VSLRYPQLLCVLRHFFAKIARIVATRSEMALLGVRNGDRNAGAGLIMLNGSPTRSSSIQNHGAIERLALRIR